MAIFIQSMSFRQRSTRVDSALRCSRLPASLRRKIQLKGVWPGQSEDGLDHDLHVQEYRPFADIETIMLHSVFDLLQRFGRTAISRNLRQPGQPWPYQVAILKIADDFVASVIHRHRI